MQVSAGGYVRSVAHELGQLAGCGAHLVGAAADAGGAVYAGAGDYGRGAEGAGGAAEIEARLPHPRTLLPEMPSVTVDEQTAGRLRNGMQVNLPEFSAGSAGEGLYDADGYAGHCAAGGGDADAAYRCDGVG